MKSLTRIAVVAILLLASGSGVPAQTVATGQVMRAKLVHSQRILEAVMTSNFNLLEQESRVLGALTKAPGWDVLKTPRYARYSADFLRETDDLVEAAHQRDLDAAALRYVALTLTCYECHRYVKDSRLAELGGIPPEVHDGGQVNK